MAKNSVSYKMEKRKKEIARQKKQEEKKQKQMDKKKDKDKKPLLSPDGIPITPLEEIDSDLHLDDNDDLF